MYQIELLSLDTLSCYLHWWHVSHVLYLFSDYLFENKRRKDIQIYTRIVEDVKPLIEDGYSVYVTGHRYVRVIMNK